MPFNSRNKISKCVGWRGGQYLPGPRTWNGEAGTRAASSRVKGRDVHRYTMDTQSREGGRVVRVEAGETQALLQSVGREIGCLGRDVVG
jgi:hypothetical protein